MNITFWVTENCNLACKYCYVNKKPTSMSIETAKQSFEYFKKYFNTAISDGKRINVAFHGGEPLLNFEVIEYLVGRFRNNYNNVRFMLTTNGTILSDYITDFLIDNVQISLSIDGNKDTNDKNRIYKKDGSSTFEATMQYLDYLKSKNHPCRIRMTVNKATLPDLADNYIYLDKLDNSTVTFSLDSGEAWNNQDMEIYYQNYEKIMDYLIKYKFTEAKYFLFNMKEATFRQRDSCDGGITTFHIGTDGKIYPCTYAQGKEEYILGDVFYGIQKEKLAELHNINNQPITVCGTCTFKKNCSSQVCKIINKHYTGSHNNPSAFMCVERDIVYRIYKKYQYILEGFNVG